MFKLRNMLLAAGVAASSSLGIFSTDQADAAESIYRVAISSFPDAAKVPKLKDTEKVGSVYSSEVIYVAQRFQKESGCYAPHMTFLVGYKVSPLEHGAKFILDMKSVGVSGTDFYGEDFKEALDWGLNFPQALNQPAPFYRLSDAKSYGPECAAKRNPVVYSEPQIADGY